MLTSIDPVGQMLLDAYPQPNQSGFRNYLNTVPQIRTDDQFLVRIDHRLGANDQLSGRYMFGQSDIIMPFDYSRVSEFGRKMLFRGQNVGLTWTHSFGTNLINEARVGFQRNWALRAGKNVPREAGFMASFGIDNFEAIGPDFVAFPFVNISGFGSVGGANYRPATYPDVVEKYQDNLTWVKGRHTIVAGGDFMFYQNLRIMAPVALNGSINYNGQYSSFGSQIPDVAAVKGLVDALTGYPSGDIALSASNPTTGWGADSGIFISRTTSRSIRGYR